MWKECGTLTALDLFPGSGKWYAIATVDFSDYSVDFSLTQHTIPTNSISTPKNFIHFLLSSSFYNSPLSLPQHQHLPHPMPSLFFPTLCILSCLPFSRMPEEGQEKHENCLCPTYVAQDQLQKRPSLTSATVFCGTLSSGRDSEYVSLKFSENYKHLKFLIFFS